MKNLKKVMCLTLIFVLVFSIGAIANRESDEIIKAKQALYKYFSYWKNSFYERMWEEMLTDYAKKYIPKEKFVVEFKKAEKDGIFISNFKVTGAVLDYYGTVTLSVIIHIVSVKRAYDVSRNIMLYKERGKYKVNYIPSYTNGKIEGLLPD